jgi:hypothetical protein
MPGGNLIWSGSRFFDTDPTGFSVRIVTPSKGGFGLDFGDRTAR